MVSLGFWNVAGQNDLPFVAVAGERSPQVVQSNLLSFAAGLAPTSGVRPTSVHNRTLCESCLQLHEFKCPMLYKQGEVREACEALATAAETGLSSERAVQAWLAAPHGTLAQDSACLTACADLSPYANFFAGGYDRPYGRGL